MVQEAQEIQRIQKNKYRDIIKNVLDIASSVLKCVAESLCRENYICYLPEQYKGSKTNMPVLNRSGLLLEDTTGVIFAKVSGIDPAITSSLLKEARISGDARKKLDKKLLEISNETLIPIIRNWLRSISEQDRAEVCGRLLAYLDTSGSAKILQFTKIDDECVFLQKICRQYQVSRKDLTKKLDDYINIRNWYKGHDSSAIIKDLDLQTTEQHIQKINALVKIFENSKDSVIKNAVKQYEIDVQRKKEVLNYPVLNLELSEEIYELQKGSLARYLSKTIYRDRMDSSGTVLMFVSEQELEGLVPSVKRNTELEEETGVLPEETIQGSIARLYGSQSAEILRQCTSGIFQKQHMKEMFSHFALLADAETLLSEDGLTVIGKVLGPVLDSQNRFLQVEWGTMLYIYKLEKESEDPKLRARAKAARMQIYHMQHLGLVRYVGSAGKENEPDFSLFRLLQKNRKVPACVLTRNAKTIARINSKTTPYCVCLNLWEDRGISLRSESVDRFVELLSRPLLQNPPMPQGEKKTESEEAKEKAEKAESGKQKKNVETETKLYVATKRRPLIQRGKQVPTTGDFVFDERGIKILLKDIIGLPGGEGTVYKTDQPDMAAKIYHSDKITQHRLDKLEVMRRQQLDIPNVCWPKSILIDNEGVFVGFLMTKATEDTLEMGLSVFRLTGQKVRQELFPDWDRRHVIACCITVCNTFEALHDRGVLMGDVNPRNFLVSRETPTNVWFVDCDSYQVQNYTCPVGVDEFASPRILELIKKEAGSYGRYPRTIEDEQFSLAILLFKMIMLGLSPFAMKKSEDIADVIRKYEFAFRTGGNSGKDAPDGPYKMIWSNTPQNLKNMFADTFTGKSTYPAREWKSKFLEYRHRIKTGRFRADLLPIKYFDPTGDMFVDFVCRGCDREANITVESTSLKKGRILFCNQCQAELRRSKKVPIMMKCDKCKQEKPSTRYNRIMKEYGIVWHCEECIKSYSSKRKKK